MSWQEQALLGQFPAGFWKLSCPPGSRVGHVLSLRHLLRSRTNEIEPLVGGEGGSSEGERSLVGAAEGWDIGPRALFSGPRSREHGRNRISLGLIFQ